MEKVKMYILLCTKPHFNQIASFESTPSYIFFIIVSPTTSIRMRGDIQVCAHKYVPICQFIHNSFSNTCGSSFHESRNHRRCPRSLIMCFFPLRMTKTSYISLYFKSVNHNTNFSLEENENFSEITSSK